MKIKITSLSLGVVFFLLALYLYHPVFLPNWSDIGPWDEAGWVNGGRVLVDQGALPGYAGNPLVSTFYALTYLPFRHSPLWLLQSLSLGRWLLFTLLWIGALLVATELGQFAPPVFMAGLLLITPITTSMLSYPTDPLFTGLAALSFWQVLRYYNRRQIKHLWAASLFLGLAALARNDGLILFVLYFLIILIWTLRQGILRSRLLALAAACLPFLILVGGYILAYGLATGDFNPGIMERTYENFESGQQLVFGGGVFESRLEARRVFGTPEENHNSILNAIRRNPQVYRQRLFVAIKQLPEEVLKAYNSRFAVLLFLLALRGLWELWRKKAYALLAAFCLWPAHLVTGFVITLFRYGHLQFPFYIVYALAGIGLAVLMNSLIQATSASNKEFYAWSMILLGISILTFFTNKLAIYYGTATLLACLVLVFLLHDRFVSREAAAVAIPLIVFCAGLVVHGDFPSPKILKLGIEAQEQAIITLSKALEPGSLVAAGSPGPVIAAKMTYAGLISIDTPAFVDSEQLLHWMKTQDFRAVYVDPSLYVEDPALWQLIEQRIGDGLDRLFSGDEGNVQILLIK